MFNEGFGGKGLYILDEAEAALSPMRQLAMLARIRDLIRDDSQLIIAAHSPIIMAYPDARIYLLSERGIAETDYDATEHYQLTREFLTAPRAFLQHLLEERKID